MSNQVPANENRRRPDWAAVIIGVGLGAIALVVIELDEIHEAVLAVGP